MSKAAVLDSDVVIYDLEDAVAEGAKAEARLQLMLHFRDGAPSQNQEQVIRVNATDGAPWIDDIRLAADCRPDAVLLPKVERPETLAVARRLLDAHGAGDVRLWAMIETPLAIVSLRDLAQAGAQPNIGLDCLVAGINDLAKETGLPLPGGYPVLRQWLSAIPLHARAFGMEALDGVYNNFHDEPGFAEDCEYGARAGFDGKTLIHPVQIDAANAAFSPGSDAIEHALSVVAAFERPENAGKGVLAVNGAMVERLHLDMARRLIARAARPDTRQAEFRGHRSSAAI